MFIRLREKIRFKGTRREGQIATFILLFVAVVILLAAVFINIARVSQKKLSVANTATGAVLQLSSSLGSYAHMLSCRYLKCGTGRCKISFLSIIMIVVTVVLAITAPMIGAGLVSFGTVTNVAMVVAAATSFVGTVLKFAVFDPRMYSAMNRAFKNMEPSMQISENAIRYAFLNSVDDPAKVADMQDIDMDGKYDFDSEGKPADLINRFYYKYTQRLMWLSDAGPGPDGSYLGYKARLRALLDNFLPGLKDFNRQSQTLSEYIGPLPAAGMPVDIAPQSPDKIDTLYSLFAYLQQEYESTKNEIYNLSYHLDNSTGKPVNIWTQGFVECPDEDLYDPQTGQYGHNYEDEDPNLACYHSKENDELDAFAFALKDFNSPVASGENSFTGFAPAIINATPQEQIDTFGAWWYYELYNECADEPLPEKGAACKNPDYEDYYDQTWELPDTPSTEFLVEKGWKEALDGWLERLGQISEDIKSRMNRINGRFYMMEEYRRLSELLKKVDDAQVQLKTFNEGIPVFRQAIEQLREGYAALQEDPFSDAQNPDYLLYNKNSPAYTWSDSLGKHSVMVEVSPYKLARLKAYRKGCCKKCIKLLNHSGTVWIRVTRRDEPNTVNLPGERALWKFRYPAVSYTATSSYTYGFNPPEFLGLKKEK